MGQAEPPAWPRVEETGHNVACMSLESESEKRGPEREQGPPPRRRAVDSREGASLLTKPVLRAAGLDGGGRGRLGQAEVAEEAADVALRHVLDGTAVLHLHPHPPWPRPRYPPHSVPPRRAQYRHLRAKTSSQHTAVVVIRGGMTAADSPTHRLAVAEVAIAQAPLRRQAPRVCTQRHRSWVRDRVGDLRCTVCRHFRTTIA